MNMTTRMGGWCVRAAALGFVLVVGGCTTVETPVLPRRDTVLTVTRVENEYTLSWKSEAGQDYAVLFSAGSGRPWSLLPGFEQVTGTGETIVVRDRALPGEARYYRLHALRVGDTPQ